MISSLNRARDWGRTEYTIIRNWTPRVAKPASDQSDHSPGHSAAPTHDIINEVDIHNEEHPINMKDNTGVELQVWLPQ